MQEASGSDKGNFGCHAPDRAWNGGGTSILGDFSTQLGKALTNLLWLCNQSCLEQKVEEETSRVPVPPKSFCEFLYDLRIKQSIATVSHNQHFAPLKAHRFAICCKNPTSNGFLLDFPRKTTATPAEMFAFHKPDECRFLTEECTENLLFSAYGGTQRAVT